MEKRIGLKQAIEYFSDEDRALDYMIHLRWPDGVVTCPTCGRKDPVFLKNQRKWQCKSVHPKRQFSVKVGTIFEDSPIAIDKWLVAVWMLSNCRNGVSSYELSRAIGVTQKSAWFMLHRVRAAMKTPGGMLGGSGDEVKTDETYVGGRLKNMHPSKRRVAIGDGQPGVMKNKTRHGISESH
jgi:transposase-like protein